MVAVPPLLRSEVHIDDARGVLNHGRLFGRPKFIKYPVNVRCRERAEVLVFEGVDVLDVNDVARFKKGLRLNTARPTYPSPLSFKGLAIACDAQRRLGQRKGNK